MWRSKAPTHARPKVCRVATGICGFYEPTERITTNQKTSIQNPYLPCKPILYNTLKNRKMGKRILYVEDDEDTRNLVKEILEKEGYEVATACNGKECLSSLEKEKPDLILLDMMLPDMSGWDIFNKILSYGRRYRAEHRIHDKTPLVRVAFLSVIPVSEERLIKLREYGVLDYIMKPFDKEDLIRRINRILTE